MRYCLLALLGGCFAVEGKDPSIADAPGKVQDSTVSRHEALLEQLKAAQIEIVKQIEKLEKNTPERVDAIKQRLEKLEAAIDRLAQDIKNRPAAAAVPPTTTDNSKPVKPAFDPVTLLTEIIDKMKLTEMKADDLKKAGEDLRAIATQAVDAIMKEVRRNLNNDAFVKNFRTLMSGFPTEYTYVAFGEALKESRMFGLICDTIGESGQMTLSKLLEEYTNTTEERLKGQLGEALVKCRNGAGVPLLLALLRSNDEPRRTIAIYTLKKATGGVTRGYDYTLPPDGETNTPAIAAWDEWYKNNKASLFK